MNRGWPFFGRATELAEVSAALSGAEQCGVAVTGTAGIGKTRLVGEALQWGSSGTRAARTTVRRARATAVARKIPFGALAPLLPIDLPTGTSRGNTLRLLADQFLAGAGRLDRIVLWLDDAHLLDDASWALVQQLVWQPRARLVATVRIGDSVLHRPADALPEPLAVLCRDAGIRRLDLAPLPAAELDRIVTAMLGGHVDDRTLGRLRRDCAGNVVMLHELIAASVRDGRLRRTDGVWRLYGRYAFTPQLVELIADRLTGLSHPARHGVELLAYGQPLGLGLLETLTGRDAIGELSGAGLVEVRQDRERLDVWLTHPLYAEALRLRLPAHVARERQRQLAKAVEGIGARCREDQLRAVTWRLAARERIAPEPALAAARHAWAAGDVGLAERLGQAAHAAGTSTAPLQLLIELLLFVNRPADAEQLYRESAVLPRTEAELVGLTISRAYNLFWGLDRTPEALELLAEAAGAVRGDAGLAQLRFWEAVIRMFNGELGAVGPIGRGGPDSGTSQPSAVEWLLRGLTDLAVGDFVDAAHALGEVRAMPEHPWVTDAAGVGMVWVNLLGGDFDTAEQVAAAGTASLPDRWEWDLMGSAWTMARGQVARHRGRIGEALRWQRDSEGLLPAGRSIGFGFVTLAELAHAAALAGDISLAHRAFAKAQAMRLKSQRWMALWIDLAEPWAVQVAGGPRTPAELALATAERALGMGATAFTPVALHDAARLGAAAQVADRLAELADAEGRSGDAGGVGDGGSGRRGSGWRLGADGRDGGAAGKGHVTEAGRLTGHRLLGCYARHALALARKDGGALDAVSVELADAGATLLAAEASAAAATAHLDAGRATAARLARARSARLLSACPGANLSGLSPAPRLTARETTIARLAATGLSTRDIAARLGLSSRTIDNHLGRVYIKLGVKGRTELATLFPHTGGASRGV